MLLTDRYRQQRPYTAVPHWIRYGLIAMVAAQSLLHHSLPEHHGHARPLPAAPSVASLNALSLGEPVAFGKAMNLWLQVFDNQPGINVPYRQLDYGQLRQWLDRILTLDPSGQYPLLAAARLYGSVSDPARQLQMTEFIYEKFLEQPNERWHWLAHATLLAKHRLQNLELALKYARAIADKTSSEQVPNWARQLEIFVLEDMGEKESARVLIQALLDNGKITDPNELRFLLQRLESLEDNGLLYDTNGIL